MELKHYKTSDPETGFEKYIRTGRNKSIVIITGCMVPTKIFSIAPYNKPEGEVLEECSRAEYVLKHFEYAGASKRNYRMESFFTI